jgi:hypothetical protein
MAWLLRIAILLCIGLAPAFADAKPKGMAKRLFIGGAVTGGAAFGLAVGSALLSLRNDAWRQCLVHCGDPLARPANFAVPLAVTSAALFGAGMARIGWEEGPKPHAARSDRGMIVLGIFTVALATSGIAALAKVSETKCAARCHYVNLASIPLGGLAVAGVMVAANAAGRRAVTRRSQRVRPSMTIGRTTTFGLVGRF